MRAAYYEQFGPASVVRVGDQPRPSVSRGQVLVAVRASSVNVIDSRVRSGTMWPLANRRLPKIPGVDLAGTVVELAPGVGDFAVGDTVFGSVDPFSGGAWAEFAAVPARQLARVPAGLAAPVAACLPVAGVAALATVRDLGRIRQGQRVLIHGGSGGFGLLAIQLAKHQGAMVTAVSGPGGLEAMHQAGADVVIDYRADPRAAFSQPHDVILNASGKATFAQVRDALTPNGRVVEPSPTIPGVIGSKLANLIRRRQHLMLMAGSTRSDLTMLADLITTGRLACPIATTVPLAQAAEAMAMMERGGIVGKVAVLVS